MEMDGWYGAIAECESDRHLLCLFVPLFADGHEGGKASIVEEGQDVKEVVVGNEV